MAERLRNGRKRHGSAINKLLNRIAEAVGLGSSASDRAVATLPEAKGDDTTSEATGAVGRGMATETRDGPVSRRLRK